MSTLLAQTANTSSTDEPERAHLIAKVGPWSIAIALDSVLELIPRVEMQGLPGAPPGVVGTFNYRGSVCVVIDVRERFGVAAPFGLWDALVVLDTEPKWALMVDGAREVVARLPEIDRSAPTTRLAGLVLAGTDSWLLVDSSRLLDANEIEALRAALREVTTTELGAKSASTAEEPCDE